MCDSGHGVGTTKFAVYLDFKDIIDRKGKDWVAEKYGNLFDMYYQITGQNPYEQPMMIYPAVHYTMGGLWVDYNLMSTVPGLHVMGEANFSDHGANRLGASALMQGLADGYFILPYTIGNYLSKTCMDLEPEHPNYKEAVEECKDNINRLVSIKGNMTVDDLHKQLGNIIWNNVGMSRDKNSLEKTLQIIPELKEKFWSEVNIPGKSNQLNPELEKAGRLADFIELGELMAKDALNREESCGGHFREEHQTEENEAKRNDKDYAYVSSWEHTDKGSKLHKEKLTFENVKLTTRSYK